MPSSVEDEHHRLLHITGSHALLPRDTFQPTPDDGGHSSNMTTYIGVGVSVGGLLFAAAIFIVIKIYRRRKEHKHTMEVLEAQTADHERVMREIPRPVMLPHIGHIPALNIQAGWDALSSNDTLEHPKKQKRRSVTLPKRLRPSSGIRLKRMKHLSDIAESPSIRTSQIEPPRESPRQIQRLPKDFDAGAIAGAQDPNHGPFVRREKSLEKIIDGRDDEQRPQHTDLDTDKQRPRSASLHLVPGAEQRPTKSQRRSSRALMHQRSFSLGAPPTAPPSWPVPPIPTQRPFSSDCPNSNRQAFLVNRLSIGSHMSSSSSVLMTSPLVRPDRNERKDSSASVEQIVAADDNAELKSTNNRSLHPAEIPSGTSRGPGQDLVHERNTSVLSNMARFSHTTVPVSAPAETPETGDDASKQIVSTPRKSPVGTRVSVNGSPGEREKSTTRLQELSPNTMTPSRHTSITTQNSSHSSNGNPFQWDSQSLVKPSALKGSPNARKGYRRQHCVRISTLTPQVLGPPPSRSNSPSITHGIEEEDGSPTSAKRTRFVSNSRLIRPSSSGGSRDNLRVQTLRASLTPSSPTLSTWDAYSEHGGPGERSPSPKTGSRRSASSSPVRSLPRFPNPSRATADIHREQGIPQFALSRPSTDEAAPSNSPFVVGPWPSSDVDIPSSPPLPIFKNKPYDPEWSFAIFPAAPEYDPASPSWRAPTSREPSSPTFVFAANNTKTSASPSSPSSPGTMFDFDAINSRQDTLATLTCSDATALMAQIPVAPPEFPGAPILPPSFAQYQTTKKPRVFSFPPSIPGISSDNSPAPSDVSIPSPLHIQSRINSTIMTTQPSPTSVQQSPNPTTNVFSNTGGNGSPAGPRPPPSKSVLTHALALRRMNSEANSEASESSNRSQYYIRMGGREPSPELPFISSFPGDDEGNLRLEDFDMNGGIGEAVVEGEQEMWEQFTWGVSPPKFAVVGGHGAFSVEDGDVFVDAAPSPSRLPVYDLPVVPPRSEARGNAVVVSERNESLVARSGVQKRSIKSSPTGAAARMVGKGGLKGILKKGTISLVHDEGEDGDVEDEDKENHQHQKGGADVLGELKGLRVVGDGQIAQVTPRSRASLYDSDGFLRT